MNKEPRGQKFFNQKVVKEKTANYPNGMDTTALEIPKNVPYFITQRCICL